MPRKTYSDSLITFRIKVLLDKIYGHSIVKDSVIDRAVSFYENQSEIKQEIKQFLIKIADFEEILPNLRKKNVVSCKQSIKQLNQQLAKYNQQINFEREERHQHLLGICIEIINLSEADDFSECNRKSAQFLGTIQSISPTEGNKVATNNEKCKPLYKAILCLRLLDRLCAEGEIEDPYIKQFIEGVLPEKYQEFALLAPEQYQQFVSMVKIPVLMAAILEDIGYYHPEAQAIVKGESGEADPYRILEKEERIALQEINYQETLKYVNEGIGESLYIGNSKSDRDIYIENEKIKHVFINRILKSSIVPNEGIGNLLKVPKIYTSLILSTKANYNYKLLPKIYLVIKQNAERGACSKSVVNALHRITGSYPQGYGITYIPTGYDGRLVERYEYAIVNQLYPNDIDEPLCRVATTNLRYIIHGEDITVPVTSNLYHAPTAKKFSKISKERLHEILELLSSNYHERKELDLIPRCWQTKDFFERKVNQKLWDKKQD